MIKRSKIVATLGPACDEPDVLRSMIEAGVDVCRLNLSHGTHAEHEERVRRVRALGAELGANLAVMLDTRGVEIRTGLVDQGRAELEEGRPFALWRDERPGDHTGVSISWPALAHEVRLGRPILIDDGRIELRIEAIAGEEIRCRVVRGGELRSHKGVYVPDATLAMETAQADQAEDLLFAVRNEVDYVAASFVHTARDVDQMRRFLRDQGADIPIIAKIESREAVENLDAIIAAADGTMVARGDLGVEVSVERVPMIQKRIIRATVASGKAVITATQMLDSMERSARPTRAEASDVANAILDGTSAVMLSGETASGRYPVEAVRTMARIAREAERELAEYGDLQRVPHRVDSVTEGVAEAAVSLAQRLRAAAVLTLTESGSTSRAISRYRPPCPILAVSGSERMVRRLALNWGVTALLFEAEGSDDDRIAFGIERGRELGCFEPGDTVVATAGISREAGSTRLIRVVEVRAG